MRWLAAGIPLTLLIDLADPGHSAEIAVHEAVHDPLQLRLSGDDRVGQRFVLSRPS